MKQRLRVAVLFGGKSAEHEVSLRSAKNVIVALDPKKHEVTEIMIPKSGRWNISFEQMEKFDVVFPVLHGPFGEDGTVQGLLKLANVPFVGPSVLCSAVGMDKDMAKRLLRNAGIPIGKFIAATKSEPVSFKAAKKLLGIPLFIKPANLGSSVGVYKVKNEKEFDAAVANAFAFDTKILIEEFIKGREVECAVLGNEDPRASVVGEIIPHHEFYSYEAKYLDENGAGLDIPAKIPKKIEKKIQDIAIRTFKALACEGMSRVDCFLQDDGTVLVNEINTIPGFTSISMFPKLWEASGIPPKKLVDTLIALAIARFKRDTKLKTSY
jgi:D-alanine-D-alanine ligase